MLINLLALDNLLDFPIVSLEGDVEDMKRFASEMKESCKIFTSICNNAIFSLRKNGASSQANDITKVMISKRSQVKLFISSVNDTLITIGFSDEISNIRSQVSSIHSNLGREASVINDFSNEPNVDIPVSTLNSQLQQLSVENQIPSTSVGKSVESNSEISLEAIVPTIGHANVSVCIHNSSLITHILTSPYDEFVHRFLNVYWNVSSNI